MNKITIISGEKQSGKSTKLLKIVSDLQSEGKICSGIIALGTFKNNKRYSFEIQDITTKETMQIMSIKENSEFKKIGRFFINPQGFQFGEMVLEKAITSNSDYIIIDEIGSLELNENGWFSILKEALKTEKKIIITVRKTLLKEIVKKFNISEYKLIETKH